MEKVPHEELYFVGIPELPLAIDGAVSGRGGGMREGGVNIERANLVFKRGERVGGEEDEY